MFAPLKGRMADPELWEVGGDREAEVTALQELCCSRVVHFEPRNDSNTGESEKTCLKTPVQKVT